MSMEDIVSTRGGMTFRKHSSIKTKRANGLDTITEETVRSVTYETVLDLLSTGSERSSNVDNLYDSNRLNSKKKDPNKETLSADFIQDQTLDIDDIKVKHRTDDNRVYSDAGKETSPFGPTDGIIMSTAAKAGLTRQNQIHDITNVVGKSNGSEGDIKTRKCHDEKSIQPEATTPASVDQRIEPTDSISIKSSCNNQKGDQVFQWTDTKIDSVNIESSFNNQKVNRGYTTRELSNQVGIKEDYDTPSKSKHASKTTTVDSKTLSPNKAVKLHLVPQRTKWDYKQFDTEPVNVDSYKKSIPTDVSKKFGSPLLPMRRDIVRARSVPCPFQNQEKDHRNESRQFNTTNDRSVKYTLQNQPRDDKGNPGQKNDAKHMSFPEVVEAVMRKPKIHYHYSDFYKNARKAVAWRKRLDQPWMKGSEMQAFYKVWKLTSHPTPEKKLPKIVHRTASLPKDFKFPGDLNLHEGKIRKPQQDFGILRECCCPPKIRIRTFQEYH